MRTAGWWISAMVCGALACKGSSSVERTATVQGPPLVLPDSMAPPSPPVEARFVDVSPAAPQTIAGRTCDEVFVDVVRGAVKANDVDLAIGDVLVVRGGVSMVGDGTAVVAVAHVAPCEPSQWHEGHVVVRAGAAADLSFLGGSMHAHLDLDDRGTAPTLYMGRLSGTAGVPEHDHAASWEVRAVEASGTFTVAGQERRLAPRTCVSIPPATKHSWRPDPGANLVAVQMYSPAGPEQRFKKLAADDAARDR